MQPEEDGEEGDAPAPAAPPAPAQPARDPRMQGFRIGGQAETAAERGEGWCGPWSTATRLIEQREAARLEREQNLPDGQELAPLQRWEPRRDPTRAPPRKTTNSFTYNKKALISGQARDNSGVPALQDLCVSFLVKHIDAVESFGVLSGGVQHAIAAGLCAERKLDDTALELLTQADASVTELVVPDCSHVSEEALVSALTRLTAPPPSLPGLSDVYNNSRVSGGGGGGGASTLLQLNPDEGDDSDDDDLQSIRTPCGRVDGTAPHSRRFGLLRQTLHRKGRDATLSVKVVRDFAATRLLSSIQPDANQPDEGERRRASRARHLWQLAACGQRPLGHRGHLQEPPVPSPRGL